MVRRNGESGYALLMALVAIFLLGIALSLVAAALQLRMSLVRRESLAVREQALADAALAEAVAHLAHSATFEGRPRHPFGGGTISSEVERVGVNRFEIVATASYASGRRVVWADVVRTDESTRVIRWRPLSD